VTTTISKTIAEKREHSVGRVSKQVNFMLCGSCFWAASYLNGSGVDKCPVCNSLKIDSIPVSGNEAYVFDHDSRRGVIVDFIPLTKKIQ
jgi:hypothetical protein